MRVSFPRAGPRVRHGTRDRPLMPYVNLISCTWFQWFQHCKASPKLGDEPMSVCHASLIPRYEWLPAFDDSCQPRSIDNTRMYLHVFDLHHRYSIWIRSGGRVGCHGLTCVMRDASREAKNSRSVTVSGQAWPGTKFSMHPGGSRDRDADNGPHPGWTLGWARPGYEYITYRERGYSTTHRRSCLIGPAWPEPTLG